VIVKSHWVGKSGVDAIGLAEDGESSQTNSFENFKVKVSNSILISELCVSVLINFDCGHEGVGSRKTEGLGGKVSKHLRRNRVLLKVPSRITLYFHSLNWGSGVNLSRDGELEDFIYTHMVWWIFTEEQKVREDVDIDVLC
jgi:hypothetical protein